MSKQIEVLSTLAASGIRSVHKLAVLLALEQLEVGTIQEIRSLIKPVALTNCRDIMTKLQKARFIEKCGYTTPKRGGNRASKYRLTNSAQKIVRQFSLPKENKQTKAS